MCIRDRPDIPALQPWLRRAEEEAAAAKDEATSARRARAEASTQAHLLKLQEEAQKTLGPHELSVRTEDDSGGRMYHATVRLLESGESAELCSRTEDGARIVCLRRLLGHKLNLKHNLAWYKAANPTLEISSRRKKEGKKERRKEGKKGKKEKKEGR